MDNPPDETDWSEVENRLQPREQEPNDLRETPSPSVSEEPEAEHPLMERFGGPDGVIMEFKKGRVRKKHALEALRAWHQGQLTIAENQIKEAVKVHTAKARSKAEKYLAEIDQEYLRFLGELGLQNVNERQNMVIRLNEQTSKNLKQIMESDWPQPMKDKAIDRIREMHESFAEKLQRELGEVERGDV